MPALEVITGQATNPGATLTAVTMNAGDSNTIRAINDADQASLVQAWAFTTTNLQARIRSPRMHDQAQNMRFQVTTNVAYPLMAFNERERVYSQDPLTIEVAGGAAEVDLFSLLVYYNNLPGINSRLHSPSEIAPLIQHLTTVEVDLTSSATSCNYSSTVALNGTFDTLIRNRDYAILGYQCSINGGTLGIKGADTGNLRVGGPITSLAPVTDNWFVELSNRYSLPLVPVINSGNVGAILLDCACQAVSTSFKVSVHLALLSGNLPGGANG